MTQTTTDKAMKSSVTTARRPVEPVPGQRQKLAIDRTAELSDEVLKSIEVAQQAAIEAVRRFLQTVDAALPAIGERREAVIEGALDMADRLVTTQYNFLREVVRSADRSLTKRIAKRPTKLTAAKPPTKRAAAKPPTKRATAKRATAKPPTKRATAKRATAKPPTKRPATSK